MSGTCGSCENWDTTDGLLGRCRALKALLLPSGALYLTMALPTDENPAHPLFDRHYGCIDHKELS